MGRERGKRREGGGKKKGRRGLRKREEEEREEEREREGGKREERLIFLFSHLGPQPVVGYPHLVKFHPLRSLTHISIISENILIDIFRSCDSSEPQAYLNPIR